MPAQINEEFLKRLEDQLSRQGNWPAVYMFKFIIADSNRDYALLRSLFGDEARIFTRHSSGGKYISVTVKELMLSPAEIVERYRKASVIEGIIAL
ncbi:hypothetical protein [Lentimicrobium sp.]|uniref:hypothetical protein n=1 Tax=Lentimicrobium sp. TaxID=2034841 RepID=UPI0025FA33F1|nr:hypothetical protein [Lentimicrobium sp.]MCO5255138.1 DUF493 domain-containing protein [Lentimicrobium sp.]MCO5262269.1 DUF493 domain-containing protein [Lentimicrobium sp.]HOP13819.1 hypothetical protein [Lentimicrobium sp.]HPF64198.1 hypothetical protein [Lentimicrobium sp.]HPJ60981.1 hypothetical protein [Lentimicrobium sp.]